MSELLRIISLSDRGAEAALRAIREPLSVEGLIAGDSPELRTVADVFAQVRAEGDAAVAHFTRQWDKVELSPEQFRVEASALQAAHTALPGELLAAIRQAKENVLAFQRALVAEAGQTVHWTNPRLGADTKLASRAVPLDSAACMVPAASAPLPSTVIHSAVCAQAAGVPRIAVFSPPRHEGSIHPVILGTAYELGLTEVYRVGGAQAVAAAALGTTTIPRVAKIVGPGNVYVALAKKYAFGLVDIDSFAGPSEVLILADESANPAYLAADMLAQAEHDPGGAVLVTWRKEIVEPVLAELHQQLYGQSLATSKTGRMPVPPGEGNATGRMPVPPGEGNATGKMPVLPLPRAAQTAKCLNRYSAIVLVTDENEAVTFANRFAPEHLEVNCRNSERVAERLTTAGAVFVGPFTPESVGDYVAGPSHVLPTGGSARFFGGLSSLDFVRRQSLMNYTQPAMCAQAEAVATFARAEQLEAHARAAEIRAIGQNPVVGGTDSRSGQSVV